MQHEATSVYIICTNVNGIRQRDGRNANHPPFYKSGWASVFVTTHSTSPHLHVHSLDLYLNTSGVCDQLGALRSSRRRCVHFFTLKMGRGVVFQF
nr:MAG TPA: hypothetical protein [Caudoviricetes sp.]